MKQIATVVSLLALTACAGSKLGPAWEQFSVSMSRTGGFTGLEDEYSVSSNDSGYHFWRLPTDTGVVRHEVAVRLPSTTIEEFRSFLRSHTAEINASALEGVGNLTTTMVIKDGSRRITLSWPNMQPPPLPHHAIDSLYAKMERLRLVIPTAK